MMRLKVLVLLLFLILPAWAQVGSPKDPVVALYKDYKAHNSSARETLPSQSDRFESQFFARLTEMIAFNPSDPGPDGVWLDFDPFVNSQIFATTIRCRTPVKEGSSFKVPVYISLREPGRERLQTHVVVIVQDGKYKISNFIYPAKDGKPSWDLDSWMISKLHK